MSVRVSVCVWQSAGPVCVAVCRACVCGSLQGLCVQVSPHQSAASWGCQLCPTEASLKAACPLVL